MTALDKFKELKDIAIKKCMQYMEEGRDKDEAINLIKPEIDNMLQFVKDNQMEFQQELDIENIMKRVQVDPLTSVFLYMMFNGFGFGEDPLGNIRKGDNAQV